MDNNFILQALRDIARVARNTTPGNVAHNRAEIIFIADNLVDIFKDKKAMAFDKGLYEDYKKIVLSNLRCIPPYYDGKLEDWVTSKLKMIGELNIEENFEGSKAVKDAVAEFLNEFLPEGEKISEDIVINEKYLK